MTRRRDNRFGSAKAQPRANRARGEKRGADAGASRPGGEPAKARPRGGEYAKAQPRGEKVRRGPASDAEYAKAQPRGEKMRRSPASDAEYAKARPRGGEYAKAQPRGNRARGERARRGPASRAEHVKGRPPKVGFGRRIVRAWTSVGDPGRRQYYVRVVVLLLLAVFATKLVQIQLVDAEAIAQEGLETRMRETTDPAKRGSIVSSDGTPLAVDVVRYEIQANPREIVDYQASEEDGGGTGAEAAAAALAGPLGLDQDDLAEQLGEKGQYVQLVKAASQEQWDQVRQLDIKGIYGVKFFQRQYPANALAGNVIGYPFSLETDQPGDSLHFTGLEETADQALAGQPGSKRLEEGPGGQVIPGGSEQIEPASDGCEITTTIDSDLQWKAEAAVNASREANQAISVMAVVEDLTTGEILVLAESGSVDPSNPGATDAAARGSRAVETVFEPGSTGKVVTMAMLLETGTATPDSQYSISYEWTIQGQTFHDSSPPAFTNLTLAGVLAKSSNVGTLMAAQGVPSETRYEYLKRFGFGERTGLGLSTEVAGYVPQPGTDSWDGRTRYTVLFGQGVSATAVQATEVFATLGNGGVAVPPHLVQGQTCPGQEFEPFDVGPSRVVVSPETARQVLDMLESAVNEGTGKKAQIADYRVAGKTGTAEWLTGDNTGAMKYVASFIGVAPAEAPRIAVGVFVVDPKGEYYGGEVAAPVFAAIAEQALQRLGVPPSIEPAPTLPLTW